MAESQQIVDASAVIAASKAATYAGSGAAGVSAWLGTIDWGFWISISIAIAGFGLNWYYAKKKDRRDALVAEAAMKQFQGKVDANEN